MSTTHAAAAGIAHVGSERDGRPVVHLVVLPEAGESQVRQVVADLHDRGLLVVTDDVATLD